MLTVDGLNAGAATHSRRVSLAAGAALLAIVLGMVVAAALCRDAADDNARIDNVMILVFTQIPALVIVFGGLPLIEGGAKRDQRVFCPCCRRSLIASRHLVIATRNCPYCGRRVLIEPEGPVAPDLPTSPLKD